MVHRRGIAALAVAWSVLAAPAVAAPASASFTSESPFSTTHDDWEPSVAADGAGHVYWATTRYGIKALCQTCPPHRIVLKVSDDGGETWSAPQTICRCAGFKYFQNDPVLAVDGQGRVYATMLNNFNVTVQRSDDFGETWSHRVLVHKRKDWGDKPWIDVSEDGWDVYVSYNGKPNGAAWGAASHDGGQTWEEPVRMSGGSRYWFAGGMTITPNGTALTSQIAQHQNSKGDTQVVVFRSIDDGESWGRVDLDVAEQLRPCPPHAGCNEFGFFSAWNAIAADDAGRVYAFYNLNDVPEGPSRPLLRYSDDEGATWSEPIDVSLASDGVDAQFPMIASTGDGDVRVAWMDDRTGRWNMWYRRSTDGGLTWGSEVRLSDRPGGAPYKSKRGFRFPYGDYGQMAIDGEGLTHVTWGEGPSYVGPGGTWYARGE